DHAIERFANRYGVLGLCKHGVPMRALAEIRYAGAGPIPPSAPHASVRDAPPAEAQRSTRSTTSCERVQVGPYEAERIAHWRAWSRRLGAAIAVGQKIAAGLQPEGNMVDQMLSGRVPTSAAADGHWSGLDEHVDTTGTAAWLAGRIKGVPGVRLEK